MSEEKNGKLFINEAIEHRNKNMHGKLTRAELGKMLFPDSKESYVLPTLSNWSSGRMNPKPEIWQLRQIALVCGVSIDFLLGQTDMPQPYPNLPGRMFSSLLMAEQELQLYRNLDESPALREIQTLKEKLV